GRSVVPVLAGSWEPGAGSRNKISQTATPYSVLRTSDSPLLAPRSSLLATRSPLPAPRSPLPMSAKKFIAELERRKLLSERVMTRLRDSLSGTNRPLSAEALAKFLVLKKQISERQARDVLSELTQSGVNLVEEDKEDDEGKAEDSSIFAANITGV